MVAFFIFLSTLSNIPHQLILVPILLLILRNRNTNIRLDQHQVVTLIILILIILLSFLNSLIHIRLIDSYLVLFPYSSLMLGSYIIAVFIEKRDIELLVKLILIESVIVIFEYIVGINTVLYFSDQFQKFISYNFFYNSRPFGLSANSSIVSEKILLAILLMSYFDLFRKKRILLFSIFGIAIILTFARTVIIVLIFYYILRYISRIQAKVRLKLRTIIIISVSSILFLVFAIIGIKKYSDKIYNQFTRGNSSIDLAGRPQIWNKYKAFIATHLIFGDYSRKFRVSIAEKEKNMHAHNSFIQVLANNGIIIFALFLLLLIVNINGSNYPLIFSLILYSMAQYGIFWGISLADIVLFTLLLRKNFEIVATKEIRFLAA